MTCQVYHAGPPESGGPEGQLSPQPQILVDLEKKNVPSNDLLLLLVPCVLKRIFNKCQCKTPILKSLKSYFKKFQKDFDL